MDRRPASPWRSTAIASTRAGYAFFSTITLARAQQSCPALANTEEQACFAAVSRSTSAKMMLGDLPPSSKETRLMVSAAVAMMRRPVSVSPVNAILAISG